ncbi:MAG: AAA family ATPase, partial [Verrucomicrobiales bacterium]|nr:AAA family ATPase [Verrucomicrobiales bacterium]
MCDGEEIDALFLKNDCFTVIEMKAITGEVRFSENGAWYCGGQSIHSGRHRNPFRQARTYRYTVMKSMGLWEKEGALRRRDVSPWGHISAMALFNEPIEVQGRIPPTIDRWFHICGLKEVSARFNSISSPILDLRESDFDILREKLAGRTAAPIFKPPARVQIFYDRRSGISEMLRSLRQAGGLSLRATQAFENLTQEANAGGNPFDQLKWSKVDSIGEAKRYSYFDGHSVIAVNSREFLCPIALGRDDFIDQWLKKNEGARYVINRDGQLSFTFVDGQGIDKVSVSEENTPLLKRIDLDLDDLIPQNLIKTALLGISETTPDREIDEILELLHDETIRVLVSDLVYLLRSGDTDAANARLELFNGDAVEIGEISSLSGAGGGNANSGNLVKIEDLAPEEVEKLLDPEKFAEWMIFLHPEQRTIAYSTYSRRSMLTGVSGSGKTCVLVHRARHLSRKYPGEKIAILTLNRSLSRLIDNLVSQLCGEEKRANIQVFAFYDYFEQLVNHLGPEKELQNLMELAGKDPESGPEIINTLQKVDPSTYARDFDPISGETLDDTWEIFIAQPVVRTAITYFSETLFKHDPKVDFYDYLKEEFSLIRSGCLTSDREKEYLSLDRKGRAIRLTKKARKNVLKMLLLYEESMIHGGLIDELGLTLAVTPHMKELGNLPDELNFRCLLVDEFQDLSTRDIAVLQKTVPQADDAFFLTGDMVQQVMVKTLSLEKLGFLSGS